jgi:hypothetical protein
VGTARPDDDEPGRRQLPHEVAPLQAGSMTKNVSRSAPGAALDERRPN